MYRGVGGQRVHRVPNSYDVFVGRSTFNWCRAGEAALTRRPKVVQALPFRTWYRGEEVNDDPAGFAALWVKRSQSRS